LRLELRLGRGGGFRFLRFRFRCCSRSLSRFKICRLQRRRRRLFSLLRSFLLAAL
jgi:hypothetical protein